MITPRPYQTEAISAILREWQSGTTRQLVSLPTGCHAKGTHILMFDGSVKRVEDVTVGEKVMGPDSRSRTVLLLARGHDEMFRIVPIKGEPFVVNAAHILSLKKTRQRGEGSGRNSPSEIGTGIKNISVSEYLKTSGNFRHLHKLYRASVEFPEWDVPLDPYFMGVLLGDGSTANGCVSVTKPDAEIYEECRYQAFLHGLNIRVEHKEGTGTVTYFFVQGKNSPKFTHSIREELRDLGLNGKLSGEKFIPDVYKINSRKARLELLAGLIDTDGSLTSNGFEFSSKSRQLAEDATFLARSLGLAAYLAPKVVNGAIYYRVSISGDCSEVPTRIPRKKASPRRQRKSVLVTGFSVEPVGGGEYFGFQVDGDHLYMMADFTVTHNSGKTIVFGMLAKELGVRTLVLAHREELLTQAVQKMRLVDPGANIGILRAEDTTGYYTDICVASVQTAARGKRLDILKERGYRLCIVDEAHHATAETYFRIVNELGFMDGDPGKLLVGVTATAYRGDKVALGEVFEQVTYERTVMAMMRGGYLCDARGVSIRTDTDLSDVHTRAGDFALGELSDVIDIPARNKLIAESYMQHAEGRRTVAFCCDVDHAHHLAEAFTDTGVTCKPVWGDMPKDERRGTLAAYTNGEIDVLTNCAVLTEGWDDPATSAILLARPTKSKVLYTQMVGRGLRLFPGKSDCLVIDFADVAGRHSLCGLSTLIGDPRVKPQQKQSILDAAEEFERIEADRDEWKRARIGEVSSHELDLFGRSEFVWTPAGGNYRLTLNETHSIWVRREAGGYMVWLLNRTDYTDKRAISEDPLPFGYAQGVAEDYVRLNAQRHLVDKNAAWRKKRASEKQLEILARWKIPHDPNDISAGDASALIDLEVARREASRQEPATHKQLWFLRKRLGMDIPGEITKGEASRMIAEAKEREVAVV